MKSVDKVLITIDREIEPPVTKSEGLDFLCELLEEIHNRIEAIREDAIAGSLWVMKRYEPLSGLARAVQRRTVRIKDKRRNGTAFSAVAPSERPVLPSIDPIFGGGIPNSHTTFRLLIGSTFRGGIGRVGAADTVSRMPVRQT